MFRDFAYSNPQIDKLVSLYDIVPEAAEQYVRGMNHGLDYAGLLYGTRYRVTRDLTANRDGHLAKGEKVHFLGSHVFHHDKGLHLYVERSDGVQVALEFDSGTPDVPGVVAVLRRGADYFAPVAFDFSKRTRQLTAASAVLKHLRKVESPS